jgi:hypothetical protein
MIIGLSGRKRCGKDTLANYLIEFQSFQRVAFADALKGTLLATNPMIVGVDGQAVDLLGLRSVYGWEGIKSQPNWSGSVRELQQNFGVAARNEIDVDVWVNAALVRIKRFAAEGKSVVVTDMRFPNEIAEIVALGGTIVRVERTSMPVESLEDTHISETLLDDMSILRPHIIINSDPIETFGARFVRELDIFQYPKKLA